MSRVQQVETAGWATTGLLADYCPCPSIPTVLSPPERAEHHDAQEILQIARDLVHKVQMLIENK